MHNQKGQSRQRDRDEKEHHEDSNEHQKNCLSFVAQNRHEKSKFSERDDNKYYGDSETCCRSMDHYTLMDCYTLEHTTADTIDHRQRK